MIIPWSELQNEVPLSRSQVWRLEKEAKFPQRIKISENRIGWDAEEIANWLAEKKAARNG